MVDGATLEATICLGREALACWLLARRRGETVGWLGLGGPHRTLNDLHPSGGSCEALATARRSVTSCRIEFVSSRRVSSARVRQLYHRRRPRSRVGCRSRWLLSGESMHSIDRTSPSPTYCGIHSPWRATRSRSPWCARQLRVPASDLAPSCRRPHWPIAGRRLI